MPKFCSAFGCSNNHMKKGCENITFHVFPIGEPRRSEWIKAVRRADWKPSKSSSYLCSEHFRKEDFKTNSSKKTLLKDGVVPSVFKAFPPYLQNKTIKRKAPTPRSVEPNPKHPKLDISDVQLETTVVVPPVEKNVNHDHGTYTHPNNLDDFKTKYEKLKNLFEKREAHHMKEKTVLRKKIRELKGKVESMAELIEDLKIQDLLSSNEADEIAKLAGKFKNSKLKIAFKHHY